jgi:hypothetical protein
VPWRLFSGHDGRLDQEAVSFPGCPTIAAVESLIAKILEYTVDIQQLEESSIAHSLMPELWHDETVNTTMHFGYEGPMNRRSPARLADNPFPALSSCFV